MDALLNEKNKVGSLVLRDGEYMELATGVIRNWYVWHFIYFYTLGNSEQKIRKWGTQY